MKKSLLLLPFLMVIMSFEVQARGGGFGSSFGGSLVGSMVGSSFGNAISQPRTQVVYEEAPASRRRSSRHEEELYEAEREIKELKRELRKCREELEDSKRR